MKRSTIALSGSVCGILLALAFFVGYEFLQPAHNIGDKLIYCQKAVEMQAIKTAGPAITIDGCFPVEVVQEKIVRYKGYSSLYDQDFVMPKVPVSGFFVPANKLQAQHTYVLCWSMENVGKAVANFSDINYQDLSDYYLGECMQGKFIRLLHSDSEWAFGKIVVDIDTDGAYELR